MTSPIQVTHKWNRPYLPVGGVEKLYLLLEAQGKGGKQKERAPVNVSLVLDRSGSMSGNPIRYCKEAARFVIDQMSGEDLLSLVVFDDEVVTVFSPQQAAQKDLMKLRLQELHTRGCTNLSGGLLQGIQHVMSNKTEGRVNRVILLSDGHANEGITDQGKLRSIAREFQGCGLGITAMGVGDGFDEELMEGITDHGGGNFHYIRKPEDIPDIFAKELEGLLSVVAQNTKLSLKVHPGVYITHIFGYRAEEVEGAFTIPLGDVFDGEVKSVLIECAVPPHTTGKHPLLEVEWSYVDVAGETPKLTALQVAIEAEFTNDIGLLMQPADTEVEKKLKITESALVIEEAIRAFDEGDEDTGKTLLQQQADQLLVMAIQSEDADLGKSRRSCTASWRTSPIPLKPGKSSMNRKPAT